MLDIITNNSQHSWIFFAVVFLGVVALLAVMRQLETRRISSRYPREDIIMVSFGVYFFGCESWPGGLSKSTGALALSKNELYYKARYRKLELAVDTSQLVQINVTDTLKGKSLNQQSIAVYFINEAGVRDKAVFNIPHPVRWVNAINDRFIKPNARSKEQNEE